MGKIKEIIDNFEKEYDQPMRLSRKDEHIIAAEELTKDEDVHYAFVGKRKATSNYSVVVFTDKRIAVVQSTMFGRPLCYTIGWESITGIDVYSISKMFTSGSIAIEHRGGNGRLDLDKISKYAIYEIEKILLDEIVKNRK